MEDIAYKCEKRVMISVDRQKFFDATKQKVTKSQPHATLFSAPQSLCFDIVKEDRRSRTTESVVFIARTDVLRISMDMEGREEFPFLRRIFSSPRRRRPKPKGKNARGK